MRYVPFGADLEGVPNVIVDGRGNDATVLTLSHWPRNQTPPELKADTSTEIVVNYLRSPKREVYRRGAEAVSNNHYDIDGLMSIWAMLRPEEALERAELLIAVGECGDFQRWSGDVATRITCALVGMEELDSSPIHQGLAGLDFEERCAFKYRETLALLPELLDDVGRYEEYWAAAYRQVEEGRELFASGEATVQEADDIDLAVFELPHQVPEMALYEQTQRSRVALVIAGQRYEMRYRYESWVELQSRRPPPRIDLRPLAERLEAFEGNEGEWTADDVQGILPRLRLRNADGETAPSSLTPGLFLRFLAAYLRESESNQDLLWSPYSADVDYVATLPSD